MPLNLDNKEKTQSTRQPAAENTISKSQAAANSVASNASAGVVQMDKTDEEKKKQGWGEWGWGLAKGAYNWASGTAETVNEPMEGVGDVAESVGELSGIEEVSGIKSMVDSVPLVGSVASVTSGISDVMETENSLGGYSSLLGGAANIAKPFVSEGMASTLGTVGNVAKVGKGIHKARTAAAERDKYEDFSKTVSGSSGESSFPVRSGAHMLAKQHDPSEGYEEAALGAVGVVGDFLPGAGKAVTTLGTKAYESGYGGWAMRGIGSMLGLTESNAQHDKRERTEKTRGKIASTVNIIQQAKFGEPAEVARLYNLAGPDSDFAKKLRKELNTTRHMKDRSERANKDAIKRLIGL